MDCCPQSPGRPVYCRTCSGLRSGARLSRGSVEAPHPMDIHFHVWHDVPLCGVSHQSQSATRRHTAFFRVARLFFKTADKQEHLERQWHVVLHSATPKQAKIQPECYSLLPHLSAVSCPVLRLRSGTGQKRGNRIRGTDAAPLAVGTADGAVRAGARPPLRFASRPLLRHTHQSADWFDALPSDVPLAHPRVLSSSGCRPPPLIQR